MEGRSVFMADPKVGGPSLPFSVESKGTFPLKISPTWGPFEFCIQSPGSDRLVADLIERMTDFYENVSHSTPRVYFQFKRGGYYAARVSKPENCRGKWVRVLLLGIERFEGPEKCCPAACAQIDIGEVQVIPYIDLRPLRTVDTKLPWGRSIASIHTDKDHSRRRAVNQFKKFIEGSGGEINGFIKELVLPDPRKGLRFPTFELHLKM